MTTKNESDAGQLDSSASTVSTPGAAQEASTPPPSAPQKPKGSAKKERVFTSQVVAWAAWDAAGAAFNAVATTFLFSVYLTSAQFGDTDSNSEALGYGMALAGLIVALFAPISGQTADRRGRGTFWLGVNSILVVGILMLTFFVTPTVEGSPIGGIIDAIFGAPIRALTGGAGLNPMLLFGIFLISVGTICFELATVNYNAMLGRITNKRTMGRVSGLGWSAGYFGGIILLLILFMVFIKDGSISGISSENGLSMRVAMLFAAAWALIFSVPVLLKAPKATPAPDTGEPKGLIAAYKHLFKTVVNVYRKAPNIIYFLLASAIFRDGLAGVFTFGGMIAAVSFGFSSADVLILGVALNVVAGVATFALGYLDDYIGPKKVMVISLTALVTVCLAVFFLHNASKGVFWVLAMFLALWVGPAQSASRTFLARRIPAGMEGEIFGLYATTGRVVTPLAPWMFAMFITIGKQILPAGQNAQYFGILGIGLVLLLGLLLLLPVKDELIPAGKDKGNSAGGTGTGTGVDSAGGLSPSDGQTGMTPARGAE